MVLDFLRVWNSYFSLITLFFASYAFAIDPVEIGKKYQEDLEINLSVIENLNKNLSIIEKIKKFKLIDEEDRKSVV